MLRDYQIEPVNKSFEILKQLRIVYLNAEMRTGKTTMALTLANMLHGTNVLFVTPKKVVDDKVVERDYEREGFTFNLTVTNYEQLHNIKMKPDVVIADEAHKFGKFPKPAERTKAMKKLVGDAYLILLSGTAYPETMSQLFHQFWLSDYTPFVKQNFYQFAKEFVNVHERMIRGMKIRDYSDANADKILSVVGRYFVKVTQKEAGFKVHDTQEQIVEIPVDPRIYALVKILLEKKFYKFQNGDEIVCDTPVKLLGKIHQIFSGTIKTDEGYRVLDNSKASYIKSTYQNERLVVFYKYIAEGLALKAALDGEWTDNPSEFNRRAKRIFLCQMQAGSTGLNLSTADLILFYNIDHSYVTYAQARERTKSLEREQAARVHWLFAKGGIENKIYQTVQKKRDYNTYYFQKDFYQN